MSDLPKELDELGAKQALKIDCSKQALGYVKGFKAGAKAATQLEREKTKPLIEALEKINDYNWTGNGPDGCDSHCIRHPCGYCFTDNKGFKALARQALKEFKDE